MAGISLTFNRKGGFQNMGPRTAALLSVVVRKTVLDIEANAKANIQNGPKTGEVRTVYRPGPVQHQASAPGESPATDVGLLVNSITSKMVSPHEGQVAVSAPYAAVLEFGGVHVAARPFLKPATDRAKIPFFLACEQAMKKGAGK